MEGPRRPGCKLIAQALAQRTIRIEADDVAQVAVHVLVVLGPGTLPSTAPRSKAIDMLDDALDSFFRFAASGGRCAGLDLLQQGDEVVGVAQQDLIELAQRARRRVKQRLAAVDRAEPVG